MGTLICVALVHFTGKRPLVLISTVGCGLCFLGTATYAHFLDSIPGVAVKNIVANVSALDVHHSGLINATDSIEMPEWIMNATTEYNATFEETSKSLVKRELNPTLLVMVDTDDSWQNQTTQLQSNQTMANLISDVNHVDNISQTKEAIAKILPKSQQKIVLEIPYVEQNRFLWLPLTLLLFSAMFAHMGIKLIPWMLIGEVCHLQSKTL